MGFHVGTMKIRLPARWNRSAFPANLLFSFRLPIFLIIIINFNLTFAFLRLF